MRKILIISVAAACIASPALAEDKSTLDHAIEKGIVMSAMGYDIPVTYSDDGTYVASIDGMGEMPGTWRRDGETLCTESSMMPGENCTDYPAGKVPGDSFVVEGAMGPATITINK